MGPAAGGYHHPPSRGSSRSMERGRRGGGGVWGGGPPGGARRGYGGGGYSDTETLEERQYDRIVNFYELKFLVGDYLEWGWLVCHGFPFLWHFF